MARLTVDEIKQGILHNDVEVRHEAVRYFDDCASQDTSVMTVVIEALERFGRDKAFRYSHLFTGLAQSEETIRWAIEELSGPDTKSASDFGRTHHSVVSSLLVQANPKLTLPREGDILAAPGFDDERRDKLTRRHRYLGWDDDACWRELEAILREAMDDPDGEQSRWQEAGDIIDVMGWRGLGDTERLMAGLRATSDPDSFEGWLEPSLVRLAGRLRLAPAGPLVVAKLHQNYDMLNEECQAALSRIGGDEVIELIRVQYPGAEHHFRLYSTGVLECVHTDRAVEVGIELLAQEPDADLRDYVAGAIAGQFSTEGNEAVYRHLLDDGDSYDLTCSFVRSCQLTGQTFPELETWRAEIEDRRSQPGRWKTLAPSNYYDLDEEAKEVYQPPKLHPITATKRPGRNDPCFCGSGKKYKKCCLNRESP